MDREFLTYVENLYTSETVEEKFKQLEVFTESLGFEGVLYTFIPSLYGDKTVPDFVPVYMTSRHFNQGYLEHYAAAEFSRSDPFIAAVVNGEKASIDWWGRHQFTPYKGSALEVIRVAKEDYGVRNGVTIPLHSSDKGIAGATLITGDEGEVFTALKYERLAEAEVACRIFHDHLSSNLEWHLPFLYPLASQMNSTEQKVLKFILDGGAVKQLPDINVSERYGYNVMRHIRNGFGFRSNEQMIHRLTRLGITEILTQFSSSNK